MQIPTRCPRFSESSLRSPDITHCICSPGLTLDLTLLECVSCPEDSFCTGKTSAVQKCPLNTRSEVGSTTAYDCFCTGSNQIIQTLSDGGGCVCDQGFMMDLASRTCTRCPLFPSETTFFKNGPCLCAPGFFRNSIINLNQFAVYNSTQLDTQTHPLSAVHPYLIA